jgi:tRNA(Ile)-lysidine synthase TilS/MesJ
MSKKGKVLMAMSGGIDSTVAALMLHKEGYEAKKKPVAATSTVLMMPGRLLCNMDSRILY